MLLFLEPFEVLGGVVLDERGLHGPVFGEPVGGCLFRYGPLFYVRSRPWQSTLCPFFALVLIRLDELIRSFHMKIPQNLLLIAPKGDKLDEGS